MTSGTHVLVVVLLTLALVAQVDGVGRGSGGSLLPRDSSPLVRRRVVGAAVKGVTKTILHGHALTGSGLGVEHAGSGRDKQAVAAL